VVDVVAVVVVQQRVVAIGRVALVEVVEWLR
jgi:hypothetical protein